MIQFHAGREFHLRADEAFHGVIESVGIELRPGGDPGRSFAHLLDRRNQASASWVDRRTADARHMKSSTSHAGFRCSNLAASRSLSGSQPFLDRSSSSA